MFEQLSQKEEEGKGRDRGISIIYRYMYELIHSYVHICKSTWPVSLD